jgi:ligand-binding sensor domain-containing protein
VYAVTSLGICTYDHRFRRWEYPYAVADAIAWSRVWDAVADPTDRSLWIATDRGIANYQPDTRWLETVPVPGGAAELRIDPDDLFGGVYFRGASGWQLLARGGAVALPASPPAPVTGAQGSDLRAIVERYPSLATLSARVLTDNRMRSYRFTSGSVVPVTGDVFLGTDGLGLIRFDPGIIEFELLPFGLATPGASAVVATSSGVLVGGTDRSGNPAITFVSEDLQQFDYVEGPTVTGIPGTVVFDLEVRERELWIATDAGVMVIEGERPSRRVATADGLPGSRAYTLAAAGSGVWIGTDRGLAFVGHDGIVSLIGENLAGPVFGLGPAGDALWVASSSGLGVTVPGTDRVVVAPGREEVPELREEISAVASFEDVVVAATRDRILYRRAVEQSESWVVERPIEGELGQPTSLALDGDGVWIGGERGFALYQFDSRQFTFYNRIGDVPGVVRDLAVDERYLWVATDGGLVRFERRAVWP